jgi:hypothetical protein
MTAHSKTLESCPFCGAEPRLGELSATGSDHPFTCFIACYCGGYSATAHQMGGGQTKEEARANATSAWNTRALLRSQQPGQDEREAFEAWAMGPDGRGLSAERWPNGNYKSEAMHDDWTAWQAARLSAPQAAGQWLPIETAPRGSGENGPRSVTHPDYVEPPKLLLNTAEGMVVGYYDWCYHPGYGRGAEPGVSAWRDSSGGQAYAPTHWMPLPPTPAGEGG